MQLGLLCNFEFMARRLLARQGPSLVLGWEGCPAGVSAFLFPVFFLTHSPVRILVLPK